MKLKQIFAAALLLCSAGAWAQTDVTSTYLTNADFSQTTALTGTYLYGYGKDGSPYGLQAVDGWTSVVTTGDNSNTTYPNSGVAGGVFSYGSATQLKGNSKAAPATNPNGEASGNCFGFFGVWGCGGYYYQNVTLAAGKYTITIPMYNQSGTQGNTTYTGFFPTSGTNQTVAVNPTVGQWVNQSISFTLADETAGQIRIGYQSTGSGSAANPMLFIDCVKIEYTAVVVKDVLATALTAANKANTALGGTLDAAISTAQAVYDNTNATQEEVNAAAATLNTAVEQALATAGDINVTDLFLTNADLSSTDGWTAYVSGSYRDYGNGLIGDYNVRFSPATVDESHLATEYCFGFECRWSPNYASFYQTTDPVPAGVYTLTFDVQNVNGSTSNVNYNNLFYLQAGSNKVTDTATEWMQGGSSWTTHTIRISVEEAAPLTVSLGYGTGENNIGADYTPALYVSHVQLKYSGFLAGAKEAWEEAVNAAEEAKTNNPNVTGEELTALNEELAKAEPTTIEGYEAATAAIETATATFIAAAPAYNALAAEIAYATTIGVITTDAEAAKTATDATAATVTAATQDLKVLEYTTINTAYGNDVTSLLGEWNKGNYDTTSGQGYVGGESYFDKWNGSAMDLESSTTVTLPSGSYAIKVAGRGVSTTTMNLSVKVGDADAVSTPFLMIGDTGKGIDTDGATNFSDGGTYSNGNIGRGWQYRYITFTTTGEEVTISINGHLNGGTWQSFYAPVLICDDATYAPIAVETVKAELQAAIDAAPAVRTGNIGDGVFQMPAAGVNTYAEALAAAQAAYDAATATVTSLAQAKEDLAAAIEAYNALEVNAPADGQIFNLVVATEGHEKYGNAIVIESGAPTENNPTGYGMNGRFAINTNLNQAVTFTKVSGNNYNISFKTAAGTTYLTYGALNGSAAGWKNYQIQGTTDPEKKGEFRISATNIDNVFNIYNTITNSTIACQPGGNIYTEAGNADFSVAEASKPSITINTTAAGWGTLMLPFSGLEVPAGVKAYTCAAVDGQTLTLVDAGSVLEANKPYIIEGAWEETVTNDAQGAALSYTEGLLTGIYDEIPAPASTETETNYILQKQDEKVGFFKVETEGVTTIKPNRAFLSIPVASSVKAFLLGGDADAIQSVFTKVAAGEIYDLAGRKVQQMQKGGVYIIDGKKVSVK